MVGGMGFCPREMFGWIIPAETSCAKDWCCTLTQTEPWTCQSPTVGCLLMHVVQGSKMKDNTEQQWRVFAMPCD